MKSSKIGKHISTIGNIITVVTILSVISKIETWKDFLDLISSLGVQAETIIQFFGRLAHLILTPWDLTLNAFFSIFPWSIPPEWQNYTVLFTLSTQYPILLFIQWHKKQSISALRKKINALNRSILVPPNSEIESQEIHKRVEAGLMENPNNLLDFLGPFTEYIIALRSNISIESKLNCLYAARQFLIDSYQYARKDNSSKSIRWYKRTFKFSILILIFFVIDKLRTGFSFDFVWYALEGIGTIILAAIVPFGVLIALLLPLMLFIKIYISVFKFIAPNKETQSAYKFADWLIRRVQNDKNQYVENYGRRLNGEKVANLQEYIRQLGNPKYKYLEEDIVLYSLRSRGTDKTNHNKP